jgi:hypothetical protein
MVRVVVLVIVSVWLHVMVIAMMPVRVVVMAGSVG